MTTPTSAGPVILIVDDEPSLRASLEGAILSAVAGAVVVGISRPRELDLYPSTEFTHAIVDLSFGLWNPDAPDLRPEHETGVDAVDAIRHGHPDAVEIVVLTRLDTSFMVELAVTIRQTWPEIRFLHKHDERWPQRAVAFVQGAPALDNVEIALVLGGVEPRSLGMLRSVLLNTPNGRARVQVLLAVSELGEQCSHEEIAERLRFRNNYVRRLVTETGDLLREAGFFRHDETLGLQRLRPWARARRPLLRRIEHTAG